MAGRFNWDNLVNRAYKAYENEDFDLCEALLKGSFQEIEELGKADDRLGYACTLIGDSLTRKGEFRAAIPFLQRGLKIYRATRKDEVAALLVSIGWCLFQIEEWHEARKNLVEALALHQKLKVEDDTLLYILTYAAAAQWSIGNFREGTRLFKRAIICAASPHTSLRYCNDLLDALLRLAKLPRGKRLAKHSVETLIRDYCRTFQTKVSNSKPPETKTVKQTDNYFGTIVEDPYRWLEDTASPTVQSWADKQTQYAQEYLQHLPGRIDLVNRAHAFVGDGTPPLPRKIGDYYFFRYWPPERGRQQLLRAKEFGQFPKVVLDGNALPENVQLVDIWPSGNGHYAAYTESKNGSDWQTLRIRDLQTGKNRAEKLNNLTYVSVDWKEDNSGFYYTAISSPQRKPARQRIFFHKLGTRQAQDRILYEACDLDEVLGMSVVDSKYLLITAARIDRYLHSVRLKFLDRSKSPPVMLLSEQEHTFAYAGSRKGWLYFLTNLRAPMSRLVAVKASKSSTRKHQFIPVIAQKSELLERAMVFPDFILAFYRSPRRTIVRRLSFSGTLLGEVRLPELTTISPDGYGYGAGLELFLEIEGYVSPKRLFSYKVDRDRISPIGPTEKAFDASKYQTELHYATSGDGTRIPVYVSYKKGLKRNGANPVILTGYGGFGICCGPAYDPYNMAWMDLGGVFAEAVTRGGGELGWHWRMGGMRGEKQNTFDDFVAAARYLIEARFTSASKLGITGGSNGGLLVAAALTQHPELFGAAVAMTGIFDMLRYHIFNLARHCIGEYGCAAEKIDFEAMYKYSPLHRIRPGKYPATLILTFANDDRVSPAHSYKFTATLQRMQKGSAPILLSVERNAGHTGRHDSDWPLDVLSFFAVHLGLVPEGLLRP